MHGIRHNGRPGELVNNGLVSKLYMNGINCSTGRAVNSWLFPKLLQGRLVCLHRGKRLVSASWQQQQECQSRRRMAVLKAEYQ